MIRGVAHVCFVVKDLGRTDEFYCCALGLKVAFDFRNEQGRRIGIYIKVGPRSFLEFFEGSPGETPSPCAFRHICLEVDDMQEAVCALRGRGIEVSDVSLGKDRSYQAWLKDPDGISIELHQYTPESWQGPHVQ